MARRASLALALVLSLVVAFVGQGAARAAAPAAAPVAASPFADWAAVVVAGDWRAHSGAASEAFDNARRDVGQALLGAGFRPQNLREFSVRPARYRDHPGKSSVDGIY